MQSRIECLLWSDDTHFVSMNIKVTRSLLDFIRQRRRWNILYIYKVHHLRAINFNRFLFFISN